MLTWQWVAFEKLSSHDLYDILALRQEVFVIEQKCIYPDMDYRDQHCTHLLGREHGKLVACLRLVPEKISYPDGISVGRVVTSPSARGRGLGKLALAEAMRHIKQNHLRDRVIISAQYYLKKFYESFGFIAEGDIYDEDGIQHIRMCVEP